MTPSSAVAPYFASIGFYRRYMEARLSGCDDAAALERLYLAAPRAGRRGMARVTLAPVGSNPPVELSVPVSGGASVLKRCEPTAWRLSMHGRWPAVHLGALSAAYGSAPYYQHMEGRLREIYGSVSEGKRFGELTLELHHLILEMLDIETLLPALQGQYADGVSRLHLIAEEKSRGLHAETPFIDVIFRRGPEALYILLT